MPQIRSLAWMVLLALGLSGSLAARADASFANDNAGLNERLVEIADRCRAVTVGIVIPGGSMGSGVIISEEGLILTAAHVLPKAGGDIVIVTSDGRQLAGKALGVNRKNDSGMAKITDPGPFPFAEYAQANTVWEGDWCVAFGHGGGVQTDRPAPMRLGRVLQVTSSTRPIQWITSDSTVISGDSGGPLFDLDGRVIGIHSNIGMSVLVNRHVPMAAYHAQWEELLKPEEIGVLPEPSKPVMPGLDTLPDGIQREVARRLNDGDDKLREALEAKQDAEGRVELSPEEGAALLGRDDLLEEIRAFQEKVAERERRTRQIEGADLDAGATKEQSDVSKQSLATRRLILEKKRERMLDDIAEDLRKTHGKIADHVLSRFEPAVSSAGRVAVEVLCRGKVVAMGTVVREDGHIVTKASELVGPPRVRLGDQEYPAMIVNGNGPNDLALIKIDASGLAPVQWAAHAPALGSMLAVPHPSGRPLAMGVIGVDARPIPQRVNNVRIAPPAKPFLGVGGLEKTEEPSGIKVGSVVKDGPAEKAGLKAGDIITAIDGQATADNATLIKTVNESEVGKTLKLAVTRGDESLELQVTLGKRPAPERPQAGDDRKSAAQVYSARGGKLSERRTDFPVALTHDAVIWANDIGGPALNLDGQAVGINIARYGRTATYAIPADQAQQIINQMMRGR